MYIKLIEQADKELENDIFAAIEQQRQEFETEFSDGGKSRSKSSSPGVYSMWKLWYKSNF